MIIVLTRVTFGTKSTIGCMFVEGKQECFTLEDVVRERPGVPVSKWKIKAVTAIPVGAYDVQLTMSNRFKKVLPLLVNVPGYEGVRIHAGNTAENTEGCILVGKATDGVSIARSREAMAPLQSKIEAALKAGQKVTLIVEGLPNA